MQQCGPFAGGAGGALGAVCLGVVGEGAEVLLVLLEGEISGMAVREQSRPLIAGDVLDRDLPRGVSQGLSRGIRFEPALTQQKIPFQRACSGPSAPAASRQAAAGLPVRSAKAARPLSEEVVEEALDHARFRRSVAGMTDDARETLIDALLDQLGAERDGLPDELRERLLDGMIDELIAGKRGEREILGQDGVLGEITRRMVQRALEEELTEHLGYPAGHAPPGGMGNSRNGGTPKRS